ncbi:MAG: hypothetical protein K0S74_1068 [Chlamydiales bacterium]|nr:hypothetical protein [Chlamydiales bacterium]
MKGYVIAHFHGDEIPLLGICAHQQIVIMTSLSRDGELLSRILWRLGYQTVRGSSSRGGVAALKELIQIVKDKGLTASLAVDGPRGPAYRVKSGVILLAKRAEVPIVPAAAFAQHHWTLKKTWDQTEIPWPFTKVELRFGEPLFIPPNSTPAEMEELRQELERRICRLKEIEWSPLQTI